MSDRLAAFTVEIHPRLVRTLQEEAAERAALSREWRDEMNSAGPHRARRGVCFHNARNAQRDAADLYRCVRRMLGIE